MTRYMPLTGHDCTIPALIIDTQAPLDVLYEAAAFRIRGDTAVGEPGFSRRDQQRYRGTSRLRTTDGYPIAGWM